MQHRLVVVAAVAVSSFIALVPRPSEAHLRGALAAKEEPDGKELYLANCKQCHGVLGAPTKASLRKYEKIPDFTDPEFFTKRKDSELLEAIEKGKGRDMKGFADKMSKDEMNAVLAYIHTLAKKG